MVALRRRRLTAWQVSMTVTRVLARGGLSPIAWLEPPAPVQRWAWAHVGDLLHVDLKLERVKRKIDRTGLNTPA